VTNRRDASPAFKIHFEGYGKGHERWIDVDENVIPPFTFTFKSKPKRKGKVVPSKVCDNIEFN
jgi:hypothetical protein